MIRTKKYPTSIKVDVGTIFLCGHALLRMQQRGITEAQIIDAIRFGVDRRTARRHCTFGFTYNGTTVACNVKNTGAGHIGYYIITTWRETHPKYVNSGKKS